MYKRQITISLLVLATIVGTGCPPKLKVAKITDNPRVYQGKEVVITGTVSERLTSLGHRAFKITDGTGEMWVITRSDFPNTGSTVAVVGRVFVDFRLGETPLGTVLQEKKRRVKTSEQ